jgi:hypothetical protein
MKFRDSGFSRTVSPTLSKVWSYMAEGAIDVTKTSPWMFVFYVGLGSNRKTLIAIGWLIYIATVIGVLINLYLDAQENKPLVSRMDLLAKSITVCIVECLTYEMGGYALLMVSTNIAIIIFIQVPPICIHLTEKAAFIVELIQVVTWGFLFSWKPSLWTDLYLPLLLFRGVLYGVYRVFSAFIWLIHLFRGLLVQQEKLYSGATATCG